jgi:CheY-like chemotaxis protein
MNASGKVLLVEDEVLVAALAVDALEELGYQTIEVTTARAAREIARGPRAARIRGRGHRIA